MFYEGKKSRLPSDFNSNISCQKTMERYIFYSWKSKIRVRGFICSQTTWKTSGIIAPMSISWEQTSYNPNDQRECHKAGGTEHQRHLNYIKRHNQTQSLNRSGTYKPKADRAVRSITLQDIKIEKQIK